MNLRKALDFLKASGEKYCYFQDGKAFVKASDSYWEYPIKEVFTGSCRINSFLDILKHNEEFEIIVLPTGLQIKVQNLFETWTFELEKAPCEQVPVECIIENKNILDHYLFEALEKVIPFSDENNKMELLSGVWFVDGYLVGTDERVLCEALAPAMPNGVMPTKTLKRLLKMKNKPDFWTETKEGFVFQWDSGAFVLIENYRNNSFYLYKSLFLCEHFESALRYRHFLTDQPEFKIGNSTFETKYLEKVLKVAEFVWPSNGNLEFKGKGFRGILKGAQVEETV